MSKIVVAIVGLVTLIETPGARDPINLPKLFALVLPIFSLFILLLPNLKSKFIETRERKTLSLLSIIFVIAIIIAASHNNNLISGLLGIVGRHSGALVYVAFIFIVLLVAFYHKKNDTLFYLKFLSILGAVLTFYGFLQYFGLDFVDLVLIYNPIVLTLGNPNFASSFLAFCALSNFVWLLSTHNKLIRGSFLTLSAIQLLLIGLSESIQGFFVFVGGLILYLGYALYLKSQKLGISFLVGSILSGIVLAAVFVWLEITKANLVPQSFLNRVYYWQAGLKMFRNHTIFGVGLNQFDTFFREYRGTEPVVKLGPGIVADHAHSYFIQFAATGGILLLGSYVAIILATFIHSLKKIFNARVTESFEVQLAYVLVFSIFFGQFLQSLISIDNTGISVWQWLSIGILWSDSFSGDDPPSQKNPKRARRERTTETISTVPLLLAVIIFFGFSIFAGVLLQNSFLLQRNIAITFSDADTAAVTEAKNIKLREAYQVWPLDLRSRESIAIEFLKVGNANEAKTVAQQTVALYPKSFVSFEVLYVIAEYEKNSNEMFRLATILRSKDPYNYINNFRLVKFLIERNKIDEARELFKETEAYAKEKPQYAEAARLISAFN